MLAQNRHYFVFEYPRLCHYLDEVREQRVFSHHVVDTMDGVQECFDVLATCDNSPYDEVRDCLNLRHHFLSVQEDTDYHQGTHWCTSEPQVAAGSPDMFD